MKTIYLHITLLIFYINLSNAQSINKEITNGKSTYLLGKINKEGLTSSNYKDWFFKNYKAYNPKASIINLFKNDLKDYHITVFMGTWCGDSKREVPRFYKVLENANYPMEKLTIVALSKEASMYKQSPNHEERGLNIHRVPTFIFYKNGKEVNRIVEKPIETLEKDIKNIINNNYTSNYIIVTTIDNIIKNKGVRGLRRKKKKLLKTYKDKVSSMYELNTYGRVLYSIKKTEEAIAVFKLNTELFPDKPRTYMSLANTLGANGYKERAIKVLDNAIKMHPENTDLLKNLEVIKSN